MRNSKVSLRYSRYWLEFDAARDWLDVYDLCCKAINRDLETLRNLKTTLFFSLSAAAYGHSKYSDIVPVVAIIVIAMDERCKNLDPRPDRHSPYWLADGVGPEPTYRLVSESALSLSLAPAHFSNVEGTTHIQLGQEEYDVFPEQWFSNSECNKRIKKYDLSITRNIRLRNHVLRLQAILQHYSGVVIPAVTPYVFSPQFITSTPEVPSYSLCDVLSARSIVSTPPAGGESSQFSAIPSIAVTDYDPSTSGPHSLQTLIDELLDSQQSLLQHCGSDLSHSNRALVEQNASKFTRHPAPSHEVLLVYHDECSQIKDKIYSEIEVALSPSQKAEEIIGIAGLWPRITPRSTLRQLARDRFTTLPSQWKAMIMHYALSILKYQQSIRLLELSSRQKSEELVREIEAVCDDGMKEWNPDWLLIQVSLPS
jgi:hypothetical protein